MTYHHPLFRSAQNLLLLLNSLSSTSHSCNKTLLLLICYLYSKTLSLLLSTLTLSILKSPISIDQRAKLAYQHIFPTNAFFNLVFEREQKVYTCHITRRDKNKAIKKQLTRYSRLTLRMSRLAFSLIFYLRSIFQ